MKILLNCTITKKDNAYKSFITLPLSGSATFQLNFPRVECLHVSFKIFVKYITLTFSQLEKKMTSSKKISTVSKYLGIFYRYLGNATQLNRM